MFKKNIYLLIVIAIVVAGFFALNKTKKDSEISEQTNTPKMDGEYEWQFVESETGSSGMSSTEVSVGINGKLHEIGTYDGSCNEVKTGQVGVLNEKANDNEISRIQCWFAGAGDEVGIFKNGDKITIRAGKLGEGSAEDPPFRGNFKTILEIK